MIAYIKEEWRSLLFFAIILGAIFFV